MLLRVRRVAIRDFEFWLKVRRHAAPRSASRVRVRADAPLLSGVRPSPAQDLFLAADAARSADDQAVRIAALNFASFGAEPITIWRFLFSFFVKQVADPAEI